MSYTDKTLTCSDCGATFTFSASEQELFAQRGYTNEPKRCPACREARKSQRGGPGGGFGDRPQRQLFEAVCASCGQKAMVPFQPRGSKPVYCSDCYRKVQQTSYR
ncbi:MAG: zinc-ribbon domain containing protein [Chloroflexi bacterium]|nr:zinc-ribbon domain containing protein [Chloroflexota bacterium]